MPLTVDEKARVAHHLGHPNITALASWALGIPALTEQNSLLLRVLEPVSPNNPLIEERLPLLREILCALDKIDRKRIDLVDDAEVAQVGNVQLRRVDQSGLDDAYGYWLGRLEDYLGVPRNPYSRAVGGGLNLRVA